MKLCMCCLFLTSFFIFANPQQTPITYFNYSEDELRALKELQSEHSMWEAELHKWDIIAKRALDEVKASFYDTTRFFTYLYAAQADAASLSRRIKGEHKGSLDPVSKQVLSLFLEHYSIPTLYIEDPYSQALATIVAAKVKERVEKENSSHFKFEVPPALQNDFSAGLGVAKWIPWFAKPSMAYWPPPPPLRSDTSFWKEQIRGIKKAQTPITEEKKWIVYSWAGLAYPGSDDMRAIVNNYLDCHAIDFAKRLQVRSLYMIAFYDCVSAYVSCKYHYLTIRPKVFDHSVTYLIPVPKHPSYPAGHSAESAVTATILSFFFPEHAESWNKMANQCALSRIWAGVHYPIDDQGGRECGKKVGEKVIESYKELELKQF